MFGRLNVRGERTRFGYKEKLTRHHSKQALTDGMPNGRIDTCSIIVVMKKNGQSIKKTLFK